MGKAQSKPPPPPPSMIDVESLLKMADSPEAFVALAVIALTSFIYIILRLTRGSSSASHGLTAVCELGPSGRACGEVARADVPTPLPPSVARAQRSPSGKNVVAQFVPQMRQGAVSGTATLIEQANGGTLIKYEVFGLSPGDHGFHINEKADFSRGCVSAGPIYNPFGKSHGGPTDSVRMVGDLGNITADSTGQAKGQIYSSIVKLRGPYSVVGRSLMVHADPDDLGKGDNSEPHGNPPKNGFCSLVTGNAGARLACGEIKLQ